MNLCICVKFYVKTGKSTTETYDLLKTALEDKCLSRSNFLST